MKVTTTTPDRHVQVAKALYSVPGELVGRRLDARSDAHTVKLYWRGELIKVHPVFAPGRRHTDPADQPDEVSVYVMRDLKTLQSKASTHGEHVGAYAPAVLEHPLLGPRCVRSTDSWGWCAAARAHVVQSAVSTAIAKLERNLGIDLFDRSKLHITLTADGATFLTEARATLNAARRARESVVLNAGRHVGESLPHRTADEMGLTSFPR
jgi:hypothetical protein